MAQAITLRISYTDGRTEERYLAPGKYQIGREAGDLVLNDGTKVSDELIAQAKAGAEAQAKAAKAAAGAAVSEEDRAAIIEEAKAAGAAAAQEEFAKLQKEQKQPPAK